MRKLTLAGASLIVAGVLGLAGSASAADMPVKAPVYVAPFTWTGIYLGINAGYGKGTSDGGAYCTNAAGIVGGTGCSVGQPANLSPSGGFVGGQVGGNYQTGLFVWGVEADIQVAHINDSSTLNTPCCAPTFTGSSGVWTRAQSLDWFGTVRGRLGLAILDRTLIYGTGGLMYGEEVVNSHLEFPVVSYQAQSSGTHTGLVAGGGIEYAFTNQISARVEGLYYGLGTESIAYTNPTTHLTETQQHDYKGAVIRAGATLKFDDKWAEDLRRRRDF
jgi:outer membrane immunogenic protein